MLSFLYGAALTSIHDHLPQRRTVSTGIFLFYRQRPKSIQLSWISFHLYKVSLGFPLSHHGGGVGSTLPLQGGHFVTKSGVWLLAAQQSIKRSGWRNRKLAVFQMPGWQLWGRWPPLTPPAPPCTTIRGQQLSQAEGGGFTQKKHRQL